MTQTLRSTSEGGYSPAVGLDIPTSGKSFEVSDDQAEALIAAGLAAPSGAPKKSKSKEGE